MLSLAILAGGKSERMGRDKALLPFLGRPLIMRILERLQSLSDEVFLMTDRPADYAFLGIPTFPDLEPGRGALGGLGGALYASKNPLVALAACDMPFISPALFAYERDRMVASSADVVIPSTTQGLEPLHALYRGETCLPVIRKALGATNFKMTGWLPEVRAEIISPETTIRFDPHGLVFWNLNTEEEFRYAEAQAKHEESN
jgi:molybdopterin-guanine dinucleotide biosynthesis protein A